MRACCKKLLEGIPFVEFHRYRIPSFGNLLSFEDSSRIPGFLLYVWLLRFLSGYIDIHDSNIEESRESMQKQGKEIDQRFRFNSFVFSFPFFPRNFIISNLIMNRSHYHLIRWIQLSQPQTTVVSYTSFDLIAKNVSLMAIRNYTTRYRRQRNMCLWCLFMLLSSTPHCRRPRGLTMYRTRVTYTSWEYVSWGMLLHRIVVQRNYWIHPDKG